MAQMIGGGHRASPPYEAPPEPKAEPVREQDDSKGMLAQLLAQGLDTWRQSIQTALPANTPSRDTTSVQEAPVLPRMPDPTPVVRQPIVPPVMPAQNLARDVSAPQEDYAPVVAVGLSWRQQYYVYSVMLALFAVVWLADGAFTIMGLMLSIVPPTGFGLLLAGGMHLLASWGQRSLIFDPYVPYRLVGIGLLMMNIGANAVAFRLGLGAMAPGLVGTLPLSPWEWVSAFAGWVGMLCLSPITGGVPATAPWWPLALLLIIGATLLAWFAETLLHGAHERWKAMYQQRPMPRLRRRPATA